MRARNSSSRFGAPGIIIPLADCRRGSASFKWLPRVIAELLSLVKGNRKPIAAFPHRAFRGSTVYTRIFFLATDFLAGMSLPAPPSE
jgi:hypothetical protein